MYLRMYVRPRVCKHAYSRIAENESYRIPCAVHINGMQLIVRPDAAADTARLSRRPSAAAVWLFTPRFFALV
jgi:hypothetical protein